MGLTVGAVLATVTFRDSEVAPCSRVALSELNAGWSRLASGTEPRDCTTPVGTHVATAGVTVCGTPDDAPAFVSESVD